MGEMGKLATFSPPTQYSSNSCGKYLSHDHPFPHLWFIFSAKLSGYHNFGQSQRRPWGQRVCHGVSFGAASAKWEKKSAQHGLISFNLVFEQIIWYIWTNKFCNLDKYILFLSPGGGHPPTDISPLLSHLASILYKSITFQVASVLLLYCSLKALSKQFDKIS